MGEIIKIVAGITLVAFLLVFALPLIKLVIWLFGVLFGGLFTLLGGSIGWILLFVVSVIVIIACIS